MAGRPPGAQNKDKPFRDALRIEANLAAEGDETPAPKGSLRWIARQLLNRAGEETAAAREVGDRLDGKPAQAIVGGGPDDEPVRLETIRRIIVRPGDPDSGGVPPAAAPGPV
jgi:hypothetical protein